jgi:hypothetical protein
MDQIPTVELFRGDKRITANESDEARLAADGWEREVAPLSEPEAKPKRTKK